MVRLSVVTGREFGQPALRLYFSSEEYAIPCGRSGEKSTTREGFQSTRDVGQQNPTRGLKGRNTHPRPFELAIFEERGREKS
jgi:hypothetical protein